MTQFKEKGAKQRAMASAGLLAYPVLQAADVLVYQATHVPVGEDQRQHLELARDIAATINDKFAPSADQPLLPLPETLALPGGARRVMSLRDATSKMSKSDPADSSRINMTDPPELVVRKIRRAKTDALPGMTYDPAARPERANLLSLFAAVHPDGLDEEALALQYQDADTLQFKNDLADAVVAYLAPMQARYAQLQHDPAYVQQVLSNGAVGARSIAASTMSKLRPALGLCQPAELRS